MLNRFKPDLPTRESFRDLPLINRCLLGSGTALLLTALLQRVGPPIASEVSAAVRPYTAAGKEERCQENLRLIGQALDEYCESNDGRYPPLELPSKAGGPGRITWVTALGSRVPRIQFTCPAEAGVSDAATSGYGLNAALGGVRQKDIPNPERVIVLAERGQTHDLALLPPLEGWLPAHGDTESAAAQASNISPVHGGKVGVLFADGHTDMIEPGPWLKDLQSWGGSLAVRRARERLLKLHPLLQQIQDAADKGGDKASIRLMRQQAAQDASTKTGTLKASMQAAYALWAQNDSPSFDADTDAWGWSLAKQTQKVGQTEWIRRFNEEQSRRSQSLLREAKQSANENSWQSQEGPGFKLSIPVGWQREDEQDRRYRRSYFRSASPYVSILVESGQRTTQGPEAGIDWTVMEAGLREKYGKRYKRLSMGESILAGETASLWEFEIDRKDAPKLRKLYVGRSHNWDSLVFTATAPAHDFDSWRQMFLRIKDGLLRK